MICSACLDFHHAQLYQPSTLFSTRSLQNAKRDKPCKFSTSISTENFCRHANARKKFVEFLSRNFQYAKRGNFQKRQVSVFRATFAAPVCQRDSLKFKTQLSTREARQLLKASVFWENNLISFKES
jgi:hypothetical protein